MKATLEKAVAQYNEAYGSFDEETKSEMVNEEIVARFIETTLSEPKRLLDEIDGNTSLIGRIKDILKTFVSQQDKLTQSDKTLVNKAYNAFKSAIETRKTDTRNYTMSANAKGALQYDLNDGIDNELREYHTEAMEKEDKDNGRTRRYTLLHREYENKAKHLRERSGARQIGNNITRRSVLNFAATRKAVKGKEFKVINRLDFEPIEDFIYQYNKEIQHTSTNFYIDEGVIVKNGEVYQKYGFNYIENNEIYLNADSDLTNLELFKINNHEVFHKLYRSNPELANKLKETFVENISHLYYSELIENYRESYGNKANLDEEILADAYADIIKLSYKNFDEVRQAFIDLEKSNLYKPTSTTQYSLTPVKPVKPTNGYSGKTISTDEALMRFSNLWNVKADVSEVRNPTQIKGTISSYRKIYDMLKGEDFKGQDG